MKGKIVSGIMVTVFIMTIVFTAYPVRVSAPFTSPDIEIGIIGPHGWIQWDGLWEGAQLMRDALNDAGGIKDAAGDGHEVVLYPLDEHAVPIPAPRVAIREVLHALRKNPGIKTIIGGFRTECVLPIREAVMDFAAANGRPIWIVCGAADDSIISPIQTNYERYKYIFRAAPVNGSNLFATIVGAVGATVVPKLAAIYGSPVETAIVAEQLSWCDGIVAGLEAYLKYKGCHVATTIRPRTGAIRPRTWTKIFTRTFARINALDVKLVVHLFSSVAGAFFINSYGATNQEVACVGINLESQDTGFYRMTGGNCEYETIITPIGTVAGRTMPVNPFVKPFNSKQFWANYTLSYGREPIYTAWGVADTITAMNETGPQWLDTSGQYVPVNQRIQVMETYERDGMLGVFKFTGPNGKYHDVYADAYSTTPFWPAAGVSDNPNIGYVRAHVAQWINGELEEVFPSGQGPTATDPPLAFGRKWRVPLRMYSLAESDWMSSFGVIGSDGIVDLCDLAPIAYYYEQPTIPWKYISGDMDNNNYFDINDINGTFSSISLDFGKSWITEGYPSWPLP